MRHRAPQSIASNGVTAGSPLSLVTRGIVQPRNRFRAVRAEKTGTTGGALDYEMTFTVTVDARSAEIVAGEYVDDLAVLGGTSVA